MRKRLFDVHPWKLTSRTLEKEDKRLQESLTSLGNGYMGLRGNFEEDYSGDSHPGTYLAGVWYPDKTRVGWWKNGYPDYFGKVINALNFIGVELWIDDEPVDLYTAQLEDFYLELDMQNGVLSRSFVIRTANGRFQVETDRFLSIVVKELAVIRYQVTVLEGAGKIALKSYLDGNVRNEDANYEELFWENLQHKAANAEGELMVKTIPNNFGIERFTVFAKMVNQFSGGRLQEPYSDTGFVANCVEEELQQGETLSLEKRVFVTTSRDYSEGELGKAAEKIKQKVQALDYAALREAHEALWFERWKKADVKIEGDDQAQQGIRFNIFQLFSTYYGEDSRLNIGPKGFTGEKYGGATYWDTEAFALPMYLALTDQSVSRNLLEYRYQQLPQAKENARKIGMPGALYPMVTFTGIECHNEWEITFEEIHRNGSMAYAIYNYTNYTGDRSYLEEQGIEVLVELSRFWAGRVHLSDRLNKYMIHGVTGPNEYENNVNNNWFTNYMAKWTIDYTLENLTDQARTVYQVSVEEAEKWQDIAQRMYFPYDEKWQIFVQHDTFLDKELRATDTLAPHEQPLNQNWSWDKILRSCFIKQADVLQGIYYFSDAFDFETKQRNFEFYEPLTVHESSLSPAVHAILAAEIGKTDKAVELYKRTARLDLDNYNNDTEDGLHITSMAGSWLSIVQGFAGMRVRDGQLHFAPFLPEDWHGYSFTINFREALIEVAVSKTGITLTLLEGESITVHIFAEEFILQEGEKAEQHF
ncbi:glycoside hydrolase family 65 protein [Listeria ilorinensis]|uniref:glycoside hydrolase family 65 protein n=1 Tax=Listeria ilorinensis TaxID=2867439 RepID=UPI001EF59F34|nr:glycoside hydrolase family 65 protein [Listeria ilorinensis]